MTAIRTALLSVHDKTNLVEFATGLNERGVRLVSTGGTARHLRDAGLPVVPIEEVTGQPEMLGGRVKTLHPHVFAGILARREEPEQMAELEKAAIAPIDLVAVNLYPFAATIARPDHTLADALEQIDIGGVSLLRAAYKNAPGVVSVVDPSSYAEVLACLSAGEPSLPQRLRWAAAAVAHTAAYEAAISTYLTSLDPEATRLDATPEHVGHASAPALALRLLQPLRYGENPHQEAAFYALAGEESVGLAAATQLQGKELSFNNILDADAAWRLANALAAPAAVIIKHANPCGAARAATLEEAYVRARASDPTSAFGGIAAFHGRVDEATAREIASTFIEVVVAAEFDPAALRVLADKAALRVLQAPVPDPTRLAADYRRVSGGMLFQTGNPGGQERWEAAGATRPSAAQQADLTFLWSVVPAVKSNAIVVGRDEQLLGVGAGQMSRVDSCRLAVAKALEAGHDLAGAAAASDAFFPFPDGLEVLAEAGITAVVQPGGSKRDAEVVEAANRLGIALVHTGRRHFLH